MSKIWYSETNPSRYIVDASNRASLDILVKFCLSCIWTLKNNMWNSISPQQNAEQFTQFHSEGYSKYQKCLWRNPRQILELFFCGWLWDLDNWFLHHSEVNFMHWLNCLKLILMFMIAARSYKCEHRWQTLFWTSFSWNQMKGRFWEAQGMGCYIQ